MTDTEFGYRIKDIPSWEFGSWLYGPLSDFPQANVVDLPEEIKAFKDPCAPSQAISLGRIGFIPQSEINVIGDILNIDGNKFEVLEVEVVDFADHLLQTKVKQEGFILCQPYSNQSSGSDQSEKESPSQSNNSPQNGDGMNQPPTITTDA